MADIKSLMKLKVTELKERLQALGKSPKGINNNLKITINSLINN